MNRKILWSKSRQLFKEFVENYKLLGWITVADGYCVYLSPEWHAYTGQSEEDAQAFGWIKSIHPDDQMAARKAFFESNDNRRFYGVQYRLIRHDGGLTNAWAFGNPYYDADGSFDGYLGFTTLQVIARNEEMAMPIVNRPPRQNILSQREREVLSGLARGKQTWEIGTTLGLSLKTVHAHVQHATFKLGATNRTHACVEAIRLNEIQLSDFNSDRDASAPN